MVPSAASSGTVHIHEISATDSDSTLAEARALLLDYGRFVIAQPGAARFCFGSLEKEAERLPLGYREQGGGCLMALVDRTPSGFIAWRDLAPSATVIPEAWELKRLWVQPTGARPGPRSHPDSCCARSRCGHRAQGRLSRYGACLHVRRAPHVFGVGLRSLRSL